MLFSGARPYSNDSKATVVSNVIVSLHYKEYYFLRSDILSILTLEDKLLKKAFLAIEGCFK